MRNTEGKYVASRLMKSTGTYLEGIGDTIEEARKLLKLAVATYREELQAGRLLKPTGEKIRSPAMVVARSEAGGITLIHDREREVPILSRK